MCLSKVRRIYHALNTYDYDTEEFFLAKDMVAYLFDSHIDRIMLMGHHGIC